MYLTHFFVLLTLMAKVLACRCPASLDHYIPFCRFTAAVLALNRQGKGEAVPASLQISE